MYNYIGFIMAKKKGLAEVVQDKLKRGQKSKNVMCAWKVAIS